MKVALFRPVLCFADSLFVLAITCTVLGVTQDFSAALDPSEWQLYGDTTHNLDKGWIQLTPDAPNQFSSIFYQKPINTAHFKARFDVYLGNKEEGADGIVFAFVKGPGLGIVGYGGQMAFLTGLDGYGIEFDTFPLRGGTPGNQPDTENHVGVSKAEPGMTPGRGFALYQNDNLPHDLENSEISWVVVEWFSAEVQFRSGHVQMWMWKNSEDWTRELVIDYVIPDWQDYDAYLGFTAATGGSSNVQLVDNITFSDAHPDRTQAWYVDASAPSSGDGRTWGTAFKTIQEGIDAASSGDFVTVAVGTYVENIYFRGKNIVLRSTDPLDPDIVENTIIDGNQAGSVVTCAGTENETCSLSGFTIRNGGNAKSGGGICGGAYTGAMRAAIRNNTITDNSAEQGGGLIYCYGVIQNNLITRNEADYRAGGLSHCDGPIRGNVITYNTGGYAGGLYECNGLIADNIISRNSGRDGGGLGYCEGAIWRNIITDNTADASGGGLYCCYDAYIANNEISRNVCSDEGGGLTECNGIIQSNLIVGNSAEYGGGLNYCTGTVINNTIVENEAQEQAAGLYYCDGTIMNCIIWENTPDQLYNCAMPTYSLIQGWSEGGEGNKSYVSDLFVYGEGDYHLHPDSRCIDSGRRPYPVAPGLDMDGHLRIVGKYITSNPLVDMGAYEYNSKPFEITEFNLRPNGTRRIVWSSQPDDTYTIWWRKHSGQKGWWELETITTGWDDSAVYFLDETWMSPNWQALLYRVEMNWPAKETP